jgi:5-formyltetrahydrofolate cyclo-ligase
LVTYCAFHDEINVSWITDWCDTACKNTLTIPQSNENIIIPTDAVILVPWRAFTKDGKRIGRGSGYYDRVLGQYPHLHTIGVCFDCQIFEDLPQDTWDKQIDEVVFA